MTEHTTPTDADFEKVDTNLSAAGVPLRYRPLDCFKKIYGVVSQEPRRQQLFEGVLRWYFLKYGDEVRWDGVVGRCPVLIRQKIYLAAVPFSAGAEMVANCRNAVEHLPDSLAGSLTVQEWNEVSERLAVASLDFRTLYNLTIDDHCLADFERGLVRRAAYDLENAAVTLKHTGDTQTATVQAHEAAEKFLKAALRKSGSTKKLENFKHDIPKVFSELVQAEPRYRWLSKPVQHLQTLAPGMQLRYSPTPRSLSNAVSAFYAALHICGVLANMWLFDLARGTSKSSFIKGRFYINGAGMTFNCRRVQEGKVLMRLFHSSAILGRPMIDIWMDAAQSAMHLEVTDPAENERLRRRLIAHMRNRGRRISPEEIGLKMVQDSEGSYTIARFPLRMSVPLAKSERPKRKRG